MRDSDYIASIYLKVRNSHPQQLVTSKLIEIVDECEEHKSYSIGVYQGFELGYNTCLDEIHKLQQRVKEQELK